MFRKLRRHQLEVQQKKAAPRIHKKVLLVFIQYKNLGTNKIRNDFTAQARNRTTFLFHQALHSGFKLMYRSQKI